ncbi:Oidioi.mRNA.OKI2018_I69.chr2.g6797.t1.cds [Oikopleura dioica]|uniref:Oidioi.mRNA.OKI2018_I69.chr2.g6797.t1.cds n=1 Tax=Oikopleura dioica TaxID=34765 RepID=A0ABN7T8Y7_OIKDI|nr:Oidioi.mRNA.OKI2018_I69.chr2.g6797.t1.cds [Oikopleura dioica]
MAKILSTLSENYERMNISDMETQNAPEGDLIADHLSEETSREAELDSSMMQMEAEGELDPDSLSSDSCSDGSCEEDLEHLEAENNDNQMNQASAGSDMSASGLGEDIIYSESDENTSDIVDEIDGYCKVQDCYEYEETLTVSQGGSKLFFFSFKNNCFSNPRKPESDNYCGEFGQICSDTSLSISDWSFGPDQSIACNRGKVSVNTCKSIWPLKANICELVFDVLDRKTAT